jgi:aprataxin
MSPEAKAPKPSASPGTDGVNRAKSALRSAMDPRGGLLAYIKNPEAYPPGIVLRATPNTVLIQDMFPKATVHLLLLPRSRDHYNQHPHQAFEDHAFLAMMKEEARAGVDLAAAELKRRLAPTSASTQARYAAIEADCDPADLPPERDFLGEIRVGIHAHPSMCHLHVHIISRDMHSEKMKHRKHYNSFNTSFLVPLADYPLAADDKRRGTRLQNDNLARDLVCWRCGKGFGNKFTELKKHLEIEFQAWSKE